MCNTTDFIIRNGVLEEYTGSGGNVVIPRGVTEIGPFAFRSVAVPEILIDEYGDSPLKSVTIPNTVKRIGVGAFEDCSALTSVTIPEGVTQIDDGAFAGCSRLQMITIPEGVTSIANGMLSDCRSLQNITIPKTVTSIGHFAFSRCWALTGVTIPEGVTQIDDGAFYGCRFRSITVPASVETIGKDAFLGADHILICDIFRLPPNLRAYAAAGFATSGGGKECPGFASHCKYIKSNAAELVGLAMEEPQLLSLMCRERLITPKNLERFVAAAQETGDAEKIALMLNYQANRLSDKQRVRMEKRKEQEQAIVTERMMARAGRTGIAGLNIAVTGYLNEFRSRARLNALIAEKGGNPVSSVTAKVDYLILNDPNDFSANSDMIEKAQELGIEIITEKRFCELAGI